MSHAVDHQKVRNVQQIEYEGVTEDTPPVFTASSPALCFHLNSRLATISKLRARAGTLYLPHGAVRTPVFMPVGLYIVVIICYHGMFSS